LRIEEVLGDNAEYANKGYLGWDPADHKEPFIINDGSWRSSPFLDLDYSFLMI
jgi:hypothetical protein